MSSAANRINWSLKLSSALRGYMKPRFITMEELKDLANQVKKEVVGSQSCAPVHATWMNDWVNSMKSSDLLVEVRRGVYANMSATPRPSSPEVASYLVPDSIVSLHTVLGEQGVLNNPSEITMAILPVEPENWTNTGLRKANWSVPLFGDFIFYLMPKAKVFAEGKYLESFDIIDDNKIYACATKEKALADWLYFSSKSRSRLATALPPDNIDLSQISSRKLRLICKEMGIQETLNLFLERKRNHDSSIDVQYNMSTSMGF